LLPANVLVRSPLPGRMGLSLGVLGRVKLWGKERRLKRCSVIGRQAGRRHGNGDWDGGLCVVRGISVLWSIPRVLALLAVSLAWAVLCGRFVSRASTALSVSSAPPISLVLLVLIVLLFLRLRWRTRIVVRVVRMPQFHRNAFLRWMIQIPLEEVERVEYF
jgi:hypothetical protein